jgi:bacterioferritin
MADSSMNEHPFLRDVKTLRDQARQSLDAGAVTTGYDDVEKTITLLQDALATEIVCVLRYTMNAISVAGLSSRAVAAEFTEHADDERRHMLMLAGFRPEKSKLSLGDRVWAWRHTG